MIWRDNSIEKFVSESQIGDSDEEPAIAEVSLNDVKARMAIDDETRLFHNFLQASFSILL